MAPTTSAPTLEPPQTAGDASAAQLDNRDPLPLPLDHDHALDWAQSPAAQRMAFNFSMEDLQTCPSTSFDVSHSDPGGTSSLLPVGEAQRACTDACMADNVGIIYMLHFRKAGGTTMHRFLLQHLMRLNLARHNPDTLQRITDLQVSQAAKAFHSNRLKMDDSTALGYFRNEMFVFPPCLLQQPRPAPLLAFTFLRNPLRRHFSHYTMDITAAQLVLFGLVLGCVKEHRQSLGVTLYNDIDRDFGGDFIPQCHIQAIFRKAQENPKASLPLITVNLPSTTMEDSVFSASAMKQHMSRLRTFDDWVGPFFEEDPAAFRDRFYPALIHRLDIAIAAESTPGRDGSETFLQWAVSRIAFWRDPPLEPVGINPWYPPPLQRNTFQTCLSSGLLCGRWRWTMVLRRRGRAQDAMTHGCRVERTIRPSPRRCGHALSRAVPLSPADTWKWPKRC